MEMILQGKAGLVLRFILALAQRYWGPTVCDL